MPNDDITISLTSSEMEARLKQSNLKTDIQPAALLVIDGSLSGTLFDLIEPLISCGRSSDNSIPLLCPGISRVHCHLKRLNNGNYSIRDNQSKNGTFLNNQKVQTESELKKGDIIKLGTLTIKYIPQGDLERLTYEKLYLEATTDQLTGCYNKSYFVSFVDLQINKSKIDKAPLSLIFFDIDFFKKLNDTYGHDAGDYVLNELSQVIRNQGIRDENDFFARYGGEEFAVLLLKTNLNKGVEIAERIRSLVEKHNFSYEGTPIQVTISLGVANWNPQISTAKELLKIADQAMYRSKHNGRNTVSR